MVNRPSTTRPVCRSSLHSSLQPDSSAAATIRLSQYEKWCRSRSVDARRPVPTVTATTSQVACIWPRTRRMVGSSCLPFFNRLQATSATTGVEMTRRMNGRRARGCCRSGRPVASALMRLVARQRREGDPRDGGGEQGLDRLGVRAHRSLGGNDDDIAHSASARQTQPALEQPRAHIAAEHPAAREHRLQMQRLPQRPRPWEGRAPTRPRGNAAAERGPLARPSPRAARPGLWQWVPIHDLPCPTGSRAPPACDKVPPTREMRVSLSVLTLSVLIG